MYIQALPWGTETLSDLCQRRLQLHPAPSGSLTLICLSAMQSYTFVHTALISWTQKELSPCSPPGENTARRGPPANQVEGACQAPTTRAPASRTCQPPEPWEKNVCHVSFRSVVICNSSQNFLRHEHNWVPWHRGERTPCHQSTVPLSELPKRQKSPLPDPADTSLRKQCTYIWSFAFPDFSQIDMMKQK